jgi:CRISPR system Cascade subunit CasD
MKVLLLRLDAPLISFGAPMIDHNGVVQEFPALSMLTGVLANAMGWDHRDWERMGALQDRIRYAARIDRLGEALVDYQTVDLGLPWMLADKAGWTTRGRIAERTGASGEATHQRWRDYRADSVHTVALTVRGEDAPTPSDLANALVEPARPLFLGRKCCLPAARILIEAFDASSLVAALAAASRVPRGDRGMLRATWWDGDDETDSVGPSRLVWVTDERDWRNQVHTGRRRMRQGHINPAEVTSV